MIGLYDDGVRALDLRLGELFAALADRKLFDPALVVVVSDHGEMLYDRHGYLRHRRYLHGSVTDVVMLLKAPHQTEGRRISTPMVSLVDVAPTIAEYAGLVPSDTYQGRSLRRIAEGDADHQSSRAIVIEVNDHPGARGQAIVSWPWKLIIDTTVGHSIELYDFAQDPEEKNDSSGSNAAIVAELVAELTRISASAPTARAEEKTLEPGESEELRALGYIH